MSAPPPAIALRPVTADDQPFLLRVYASTRERELAQVPFSPEQKAAFLAQQFRAQSVHYANHYGDASFDLVEVDGVPAGRLIVARWADRMLIVDVALLDAFRGRGIGTRLLQPLLAEADADGKRISIHVERQNPAQRLYARLGFSPVSDGEEAIYQLWVRPPRRRRPRS